MACVASPFNGGIGVEGRHSVSLQAKLPLANQMFVTLQLMEAWSQSQEV